MSMIDWYVEGPSFSNCNCDWSCPCQFESLPTHGDCRAFGVFRIDKGHFGDLKLDGLKAGALYAWPGPVFEGKGEMQAIIDEQADEAQRAALYSIICGENTNEAATHWWVYHAMCDQVHETLFKPIEFHIDIEARKAHVVIPDIVQSIGSPIRSPATGDEHRVLDRGKRSHKPEPREFIWSVDYARPFWSRCRPAIAMRASKHCCMRSLWCRLNSRFTQRPGVCVSAQASATRKLTDV
jgi:hypothetical protein